MSAQTQDSKSTSLFMQFFPTIKRLGRIQGASIRKVAEKKLQYVHIMEELKFLKEDLKKVFLYTDVERYPEDTMSEWIKR